MYSWIAYNLLCKEHLIGKYYRFCLIIYAGKLIRYGTGEIILKFPPFCQLNEEYQKQKSSK